MEGPEYLHVKTGIQTLILHLNEYSWTLTCLSILYSPQCLTGRAPSEQHIRDYNIHIPKSQTFCICQ